jgi:leader peptidase (prepilin peptidase) / N-methyltransferase
VIVPVISGLYGLIIGSFLNVVVHRVPAGLSVNRPRSRCPQCEHGIAWYDNIPVVSWLILRGRCRNCATQISSRYPAVEALTAALFGVVAWSIGWSWELPAMLVFVAVLVALSAIDIDTRTLPNKILYPASAAGAVLLSAAALLSEDPSRLIWVAAGGALGFAILFAIWFAAPGGMGYGDVRLSGYLGLHLGYLGLGHVAVALFVGFLAGALTGVAVMLATGRSRKSSIPFGPFLALGALVALLVGDAIIDLYLG